jgi:hypothetical protein
MSCNVTGFEFVAPPDDPLADPLDEPEGAAGLLEPELLLVLLELLHAVASTASTAALLTSRRVLLKCFIMDVASSWLRLPRG